MLRVNAPSGRSKGARGTRPPPPPPGVQILSISCSFRENLAKSYVGAPPPGSWRSHLREILDPSLAPLIIDTWIDRLRKSSDS